VSYLQGGLGRPTGKKEEGLGVKVLERKAGGPTYT